jgi:hypothetical protein
MGRVRGFVLPRAVCLAALSLLAGCNRLFYEAMEKIGREKRDILASRLVEGRKDQEEAKRQFQSTLEAFQALTGFDGGDLEKTYNKRNSEFEDAERRAEDVRRQIRSIEQVSADMLTEWSGEIETMRSADLRDRSRAMLTETRGRYTAVIGKMRDGERRMEPVLISFRDQVLFLKHNLNARAIRSLKTTAARLDTQVSTLVRDLDSSIQEADTFIAELRKQPTGE